MAMPISSTRRAAVERAVISRNRATSRSAMGTRWASAYSSISASSPVFAGSSRSRYSACSGRTMASRLAFIFLTPLSDFSGRASLSLRGRGRQIHFSGVGIILRVLAGVRPVRDGDVAPRQPQLAQLVLERLPVHAEDGRGARHVPARLFEAARDVAALELAPVLAEVGREGHGQGARLDDRRGRGRLLRPFTGSPAHLFRQVLRGHLVALRENHRALDGVAQLAHVARPVVLDEAAQRGRGERARREAVALRGLSREGVGEARDVFAPFAERGYLDGDDLKPVE